MLEGKGKFYLQKGHGGIIRVPADVVKDSQFPFRHKSDLKIKIEKNRLVIFKHHTRL